MAYSRGASALGVALALDECDASAISDDIVCRDVALFSRRASTSAGVELSENQILVIGNSAAWGGDLVIAHDVMADAIDTAALARVLGQLGIAATLPLSRDAQSRVVAALAKAEPSRSGVIRGARHTMLDDSDISGTRHARALVGGVLAGVLGTTDAVRLRRRRASGPRRRRPAGDHRAEDVIRSAAANRGIGNPGR